MRTRIATLMCIASIAASGPVLAHHSFAATFDEDKPVAMTGTVTRVEWSNPHIWFFIDVENADGTVTNWGFEMGSPNFLMRAGWRHDSMKVGDVVDVEGSQSRDDSPNAHATTVVLSDSGEALFSGPQLPPAR